MRHVELGEAQVWSYPDQRTAVLWECFLLDGFRQDDPRGDQVLTALWQGVERLVLERCQVSAGSAPVITAKVHRLAV